MKTLAAATAAVVATLALSRAHAQPAGATAQAEVLFRQGKELMASGRFAEACAAFDASQKLEATPATRLNQANCREKNNQLATAWGLFLDAERETRAARDDAGKAMHKTAADRAKKLEPRVSSLKLVVAPDRKLPGLEIRRDGDVIDPATWNTALPLDGGTYKITAKAPNLPEWTQAVVVGPEKDAKVVEIPKLDTPAPKPVAPVPPAGGGQTAPPPIEARPVDKPIDTRPIDTPPVAEGSRFTTRRKIAIGVGVVGLAAVAFGVARGTAATGKQSDAEDLCPDPAQPCTNADAATALTRDGHDLAFQANVGFGIGAAAVIAAGVLWFTGAPVDRRVTIAPRATANQLGLAVVGRF